jgi:hypothetical protein
MRFTRYTKLINDMEFQYQTPKKMLVNKMIGLYKKMSYVTKWVKRHGFSNS